MERKAKAQLLCAVPVANQESAVKERHQEVVQKALQNRAHKAPVKTYEGAHSKQRSDTAKRVY